MRQVEKSAEVAKKVDAAEEADAGDKTEDKKEKEKKAVVAGSANSNNASNQQRRGLKRKMDEEPFVVVEDEPEIDEDLLCLDWFNSDLNLKIDKSDLVTAEPFYKEGWGYVWASARGTHGFTSGKVCFEVKLVDNMDAKVDNEKAVHEVRVGWSADAASLTLGEDAGSICYAGTAKQGRNGIFQDFGATFAKGDVVGAFADFDQGQDILFTFTKNGEKQGEAIKLSRSDFELNDGVALFPHVSTHNVKVEVNFGRTKAGEDKDAAFAAPEDLAEYVLAGRVPKEGRSRGMARIAKREDCEMILLVGLPAAGKTTWANKHREANPDKRYYVIGTSALLERMKVRRR